MSNELFKAFDNGSLRLPASSTEFTDLPWAKHPVFEGGGTQTQCKLRRQRQNLLYCGSRGYGWDRYGWLPGSKCTPCFRFFGCKQYSGSHFVPTYIVF